MAQRLLIADDDNEIRELLEFDLSHSGYEVDCAKDGEEALQKALVGNYDLILLDVMMPKMNGYEFTKTLRYANNTLPILMVSAKQLPRDKHLGFDAGIDDYMTKPIEKEEFLYRIKALLRRAKIASDRKIVIGDVVIDYDAMTVKRGEEVMELPQKEFLLLYKLLSYPDKIFTRIQIMDEIWGVESEVGWETVTVHIARLRKRFEGWNEFSIESIRGVGYKAVKRV